MTNRLLVCLLGVLITLSACSESLQGDIVSARRSVEDYRISSVTFRSMERFFPTVQVARGAHIMPIEMATSRPITLDSPVNIGDGDMQLADALAATDTNALLVFKDGKLVFEHYRNGATEDSRFIGWSMSKSVVSLLVGIALDEGVIGTIDDPVERYWPAMSATPFGEVSIRHMLEMRAGVDYTEWVRFGEPDVNVLAQQSLFTNEKRFTDVEVLELERVAAPGEVFNYSTLTTAVLARVLEEAWGKPLADLTSEKLWQPAGMQADAFWLLDGPPPDGQAFGGGGINATARDFGRLGLMVWQKGELNGTRIVPADWIAVSTRHEGDEPVWPGTPRGYGYHWWTFIGTNIHEAVGIHGQFVSIDPDTNTVIVKLSHWPERGGGERQNLQLLNSLRSLVTKT